MDKEVVEKGLLEPIIVIKLRDLSKENNNEISIVKELSKKYAKN